MKAAYAEAIGGPGQVKVGELPDPDPGDDKILIRNSAAGIGPWDWKRLAGMFGEATFPMIPSSEAAGVVAKAPDGSGFKPGDAVWGRVGSATAEYVVSDGNGLVPRPAALSPVEAAALVIGASTAHEGLVDKVKVQPGETVLVTAASGGVGGAAVQIAASAGARVIGVSSARNHDYVRSLGASDVFDYNDEGWTDQVLAAVPGGVDVIFDSVGGDTGQAALKTARKGARGAFVAWPMPDWESESIEGHAFSAATTTETMEAINQLVEDGKLKPPAITTMPLDQAADALTQSQQGHVRGKLVLEI